MSWQDDLDATARRDQEEARAYDAAQQAYRQEQARQASIAWQRLNAMLHGERPTRETNDEWAARKAAEAAQATSSPRAGMLPVDPTAASDPYFYYKLRNTLPANDPRQAELGPLEHQQVMQEMVSRNPLSALPLALVGIPGYTLGKATGMIQGARSPASLEEMEDAYRGLWQGLVGQ